MFRVFLVFSVFFFSACSGPIKENSVAMCCVFKNEAKYLPEWIEFHKKQGVSKFYLYNNLSTDKWKETLAPYIDSGLVEVIDWPYESQKQSDWNIIQCNSYLDCINRVKDKFTWCVFLDADEFIFVVNGGSLPEFLKPYRRYPGVMVNWVMYGTSHLLRVPEGEKLVDNLLWRAPIDYEHNRNFKTIVRPKEVIGCENPHYFIYKNGNLAVDENMCRKKNEEMITVSVNYLRINHYWSRDAEFFFKVKLPRRIKWYNEYQRCLKIETEMNKEYDPILKSK